MNFLAMQNDVLNRLNETAAAGAGVFRDGAGGITAAGLATIGGYINDALADIARWYWPTSDTGTYSWPSGQLFANFTLFTCTANAANVLINMRSAQWNGVPLTYCERSAIENWYPTMITDATGTPQYIFADAIEGVGLYPTPSATQTVTIRGQVIPAPLSLTTDAPSWLPADLHYTAVLYACHQVVLRNADDTTLRARASDFEMMYQAAVDKIRSRVYRTDPQLAADLSADPPQAIQPPGQ